MMRRLLFALMVLAAGPKSVWSNEQPKLVPGMTRDEVRKQFGEPRNFYSRKTRKHYASGPEASAAEQMVGPLLDVYNRRTASNEYELRIEYAADKVESRLRPTIRASRAWFVADKAIAGRIILADMAEAVDLCKNSACRLKAKVGPPRTLECLVDNPTSEQENLARNVATGWQASEGGGVAFKWTPAIILTREAWNYDHTSPMQAVNWLDEKIEEAELSATDLLQESRESNQATHRPMIDLGIWNPGLLREDEPVGAGVHIVSQPDQAKPATEIASLPSATDETVTEVSAPPPLSQSTSHKIVCSDRFAEVPFSSSRPDRKKLACGEEVSIVRESGLWTRIKTKDGLEGNVATRFVGK